MARYTYVIASRAHPGREDEYKTWYAEQHLADVSRHPDIVGATLHEVVFQKDYDLDAPGYVLMTVYELDSDDPAATVEHLRSQAGLHGMPMSDSLNKAGMLQLVGRRIASVG